MAIIDFLTSIHGQAIIFYGLVFLLIYLNRKKFDFEAKIVALYRTKLGIKAMEKLGTKFRKTVKWLAYAGIVVGYLGMALIVFVIFKGTLDLFIAPEAPPVITPVIPGVQIPGSPIHFPLWYTLLAIFVAVVIHEFSHGVVSKAHNIPVKSSGFALFGPIPGAFVEPDEEVLKSKSTAVQNSIFAAGPFSNVITAGIIILIFIFAVGPFLTSAFPPQGFIFPSVINSTPADAAGLQTGVLYTTVNNISVNSTAGFLAKLEDLKPGDSVWIGNGQENHEVIAGENPEDEEDGYLGVTVTTRFKDQDSAGYAATNIFIRFLNWVLILSLGLGLANLLPIGPVDGGRMYQLACRHLFGEEKGDLVWAKTSMVFLALILVLLVVPIVRAVI